MLGRSIKVAVLFFAFLFYSSFSLMASENTSTVMESSEKLKIIIIVLFILIFSLLIRFFYRFIYDVLDRSNKKYRLRRR